ncbi:dephospho-CoA kinase [Clostridium sp.]|uniref:dephospho-CoA kinase n=1 Tax=Clostridium sp. TaxID=1506 RepID=UPI001A629775|nr:dephospho-CoA kinase [Clostridium sp.]MBK5241602.1 dephospho-CoA kinase [Clostridium sp.]
MLKVGITGGIGSGKSTVTNMIRNKCFPIVDADIVAKEVFILYPEVLSQIKEEFGYEFFSENDKLMRKEFGNYIFKSEKRRKKLENIMMPYILSEIHLRVKKYEENNCELCFLDAPTLIENNLHTIMDKTILVWASREVQIQRVMSRDTLKIDQVIDRIRAQMPIDEKKKFADFIIDNEGSLENTKLQVDFIITKLERLNVKSYEI